MGSGQHPRRRQVRNRWCLAVNPTWSSHRKLAHDRPAGKLLQFRVGVEAILHRVENRSLQILWGHPVDVEGHGYRQAGATPSAVLRRSLRLRRSWLLASAHRRRFARQRRNVLDDLNHLPKGRVFDALVDVAVVPGQCGGRVQMIVVEAGEDRRRAGLGAADVAGDDLVDHDATQVGRPRVEQECARRVACPDMLAVRIRLLAEPPDNVLLGQPPGGNRGRTPSPFRGYRDAIPQESGPTLPPAATATLPARSTDRRVARLTYDHDSSSSPLPNSAKSAALDAIVGCSLLVPGVRRRRFAI